MLTKNDYDNAYKGFVPAVLQQGLPYRLEEASNYARGGQSDASDTFAACLWGLDYMYWWASHRCAGINFHTGSFVPKPDRPGFRYSVFATGPDGFDPHPLAYGLLAFKMGSDGRLIETRIDAVATPPLNLRAYSVLAPDKAVYVTLINRENGPGSRPAEVDLEISSRESAYARAQIISVSAPNGDVAAKTGILLGGATIKNDGSWSGTWADLPNPGSPNHFQIKLPPATVAVLKLTGAP